MQKYFKHFRKWNLIFLLPVSTMRINNLKIAPNHSQHETKMKYNIQFGIAPYVKEILIKDVCKGTAF